MTQVAEGDRWELVREPGEGEYEDKFFLRLHTAYGIIEVESFVDCDSRNWTSYQIQKQYNRLKEQ